MLPSPILSVANLRKQYGATTAVDGISFEVRPNEIVGLLGPNGAGKTTTINIILGALEPTAGTVLIEGADIATRRRDALARTNFAAAYAPLPFGNLTVEQNLRIFGMLYDVKNLSGRIEELLEEFELRNNSAARKPGCCRRAVTIAAERREGHAEQTELAVARRTDRVTRSVGGAADPRKNTPHRQHLIIGNFVTTSHNMNEVESVCHRVLFLAQGKILLGKAIP